MILRDVLLRGRGADIGVRAPLWFVRLCGATLCVASYWMADALGLWSLIGLHHPWMAQTLLLVAGAIIAPSSIGGVLWLVNGVLVSTLMLVMYTPIVTPFVARFVRADLPGNAPVDAVLVFSGSLTDDGRINGQALDRLLTAMAVAKQRRISELALSVVVQERQPSASSEADQRALVALAAPELSLRLVSNVHSSRDEALAFAALARTHGWTRVLVVTSPMHTQRACASVEQMGLMVECRPAEARDFSLRSLQYGENRRLAFQEVVYETLATVLYRSRGWMR